MGAAACGARCGRFPGFVDVQSDMQIASPQLMVDIDRDRALALGITPQSVQDALFSGFSQREVSVIYAPANQYSVILELLPKYQRTPDALSKVYLRSSNGSLVPLDAVVKAEAADRPAADQPLRTVAGGDDRVQPAARASRSANRPRTVDNAIREIRMPATINRASRGR